MLCNLTPNVVADYFDNNLSMAARVELDEHLHQCADCRQEIATMQTVVTQARAWQEQSVPEWNRRSAYTKRKKLTGFNLPWLQWGTLAASFTLALAVLFNVQISRSDAGFTVAFGGNSAAASEQQMQELASRVEQQQREDTLAMMQVVMLQLGDTNAQNLNQLVDYFERQRQLDLQLMQASYQQLMDSDYQTIRSVQQLASYVQFQDGN